MRSSQLMGVLVSCLISVSAGAQEPPRFIDPAVADVELSVALRACLPHRVAAAWEKGWEHCEDIRTAYQVSEKASREKIAVDRVEVERQRTKALSDKLKKK